MSVAEEVINEFAVDVAVNVVSFVSPSTASTGTSTLTHTSIDSPVARVGVVAIGVVQVAS